MKNLENFGVQELNASELVALDAGWDLTNVGQALGFILSFMAVNVVEGILPPSLPSPRDVLFEGCC